MMLTGIDAIRKRPGMYIGSTQKEGVLLLIREVIDAIGLEMDWNYISIFKSGKQFTICTNQPIPFNENYKILHPYRFGKKPEIREPIIGLVGINALSKIARFRFKNRIVTCQQGKEIENIKVEAIENFEVQFELDETIMEETTIPMYVLKKN